MSSEHTDDSSMEECSYCSCPDEESLSDEREENSCDYDDGSEESLFDEREDDADESQDSFDPAECEKPGVGCQFMRPPALKRQGTILVPSIPVPSPPPRPSTPAPSPTHPLIDESDSLTRDLNLPDPFALSTSPTSKLLNGDYEEDPETRVSPDQHTPKAAMSMMKSLGTLQTPPGTAVPWNNAPLKWQGKSKADLCKLVFPTPQTMVGLHELYNRTRPFKDELAPTVVEIDLWNLSVLRHFRRLIGNPTPMGLDRKLFLQCHWADERKYTTKWNVNYPEGICIDGSGSHCGWTFLPNCIDQATYLEQYEGVECITFPGPHSEGIGGVSKNIPWSFKLASVLRMFLCQDGPKYHMGPLFGNKRTKVGISFWDKGDSHSVRLKWR